MNEKFLRNSQEEKQKLTLKQRMLILSRKDRMGRAMPTWYRILPVTVLLVVLLVVLNGQRREALEQRVVVPEPVAADSLRLTFGGDIMLSRGVERLGQVAGYDSLFAGVKPLWADSALTFASLEGTVLPGDPEEYAIENPMTTPFPMTREALNAAVEAGVTTVSVANDHALDYGSAGLALSLQAMDAAGLNYAGGGENLPAAGLYRIYELNGMKVGFVACSAVNPNGPGPIDDYCITTTAYSALYRNVLLASDLADYVVVYVCWGEEGALTTAAAQQAVAHQLIQSGADLVIGTHPRVVQPVEKYAGGWIFYSLGDLLYDADNRAERESVLLRLEVNPETRQGEFTLIPLVLEDFCPYPAEGGFHTSQVLRRLLKTLPENAYTISEDGRVHISMSIS